MSRAFVAVLCIILGTTAQPSFDDDIASSLDREDQINDLLNQDLPEEMGMAEQLRKEEGSGNEVDQFVWQDSRSPNKVPVPSKLQPYADLTENRSLFDKLFKVGSHSKTAAASLIQAGKDTLELKSPTEEKLGDLEGATGDVADQIPETPEIPDVPKPPTQNIPREIPKPNDSVFNELMTKAYAPSRTFVNNAISDLQRLYQLANGNLAKQMLVAETANSYVLPAVSGIWPAMMYYHIQQLAAKSVAPSWWPTDPMPGVPASKQLPRNTERGGITGASSEMNAMLGLRGGNTKHHCSLNNMLDCVD